MNEKEALWEIWQFLQIMPKENIMNCQNSSSLDITCLWSFCSIADMTETQTFDEWQIQQSKKNRTPHFSTPGFLRCSYLTSHQHAFRGPSKHQRTYLQCVIFQSLCVSAVFDKLDQAAGRKIIQVQAAQYIGPVCKSVQHRYLLLVKCPTQA